MFISCTFVVQPWASKRIHQTIALPDALDGLLGQVNSQNPRGQHERLCYCSHAVSLPLPKTTMMSDSDPYELRAKYTRFRILVIGRANAGKTTLLQRVCNTTEDPCIYDDDKNLVSVQRPEDDEFCF